MINNFDFLNKNIFRNFPIRQKATRIADNGLLLSNFIIAGISLSLPINASNPFISQVSIINGFLSIAISANGSSIGYFQGQLNQDFQIFNLVNTDGYSSGFLITGLLENILSINGVFPFSSINQTGLEISTYNLFQPSGVKSLNYRNQKLVGNITFGLLDNITELNVTNSCTFSVISNSDILSLADKSSQFKNCNTPVITNINNVVPYPVANLADDANIYLFGINPVVFTNDTDSSTYATIIPSTVDLDLNTFCTLNGAPFAPVNPNYLIGTLPGLVIGDDNGYNNYYSKSQSPIVNFIFENAPEYLSWPYYVTTFNKTTASPVNGNYIVINPTVINGTVNKIYAITDTGTVSFNIKISSTNVESLTSLIATSNGLVVLATGTNNFITTDSINLDIIGVTGTPTSFQLVIFYSQQF